ncbi:unnamed protein product, partial [Musa textilis]
ENRTAVRDKGSSCRSRPRKSMVEPPLKTKRTEPPFGKRVRAAAQDQESRTAVRDKGSSRRSRPRKPMVEPSLKTKGTEPSFGIRGRAA